MKKDEQTCPDTAEGYIYVGRWRDGALGWNLSPHMIPKVRSDKEARRYVRRTDADRNPSAAHEPHYLCRVKLELVRDSLGRPIVHYPGGKKG